MLLMEPYLTSDFDGIGGAIRERDEDFFVQEVPLYEPAGDGEHLYVEIQKIGLTTFDAIDRIARQLNVNPRDIGFAGMKDRHAITRQVLSIPGVSEEAAMKLQSPELSVLWAARHRNKLKLGHLKGNRFAIKIRHVEPSHVVRLTAPLQTIHRRGLPNYFGEQRFGVRGDNDLLGAALIRGDNKQVLHLLLGNPRADVDPPEVLQARTHFDRSEFEQSLRHWPRSFGMERRLLARFSKATRPGATVRMIDQRIKRLWISALQSRVFNEVLARRIDSIDRILEGEVCEKTENGACFIAEDLAVEQARADAWEISPTGPLIGYKMTHPLGAANAIEQEVFAKFNLTPADLRGAEKARARGARRSLRVRPAEVVTEGGVDEHGAYILVAFTLPSGSFATTLLREIMKPDRHEPPPSAERDDAVAIEDDDGAVEDDASEA
jgi:tRNA pseudouridine13 synthase